MSVLSFLGRNVDTLENGLNTLGQSVLARPLKHWVSTYGGETPSN